MMKKIIIATILITLFVNNSVYGAVKEKIKEKNVELNEVNNQIDSLNQNLEVAVEEYNQARINIGYTKARIIEAKNDILRTSAELQYNQSVLNSRVKSLYTKGKPSILDFVFSISEYSDLFKVADYYKFIIRQDSNAIKEVRRSKLKIESLKANLESEMAKKEIEADVLAEKKQSVEDALGEKQTLLNKIKVQLKELQRQEREEIERIRKQALKQLQNVDYSRLGSNSKVIEIAKKYLGVRYTWGGESPQTGFDCSGFAWYVYRKIGVYYLPRTSRTQYNYLRKKGRLVAEANLQPGDLVFYGRGYVSDVKIYMGGGYVIGASGGRYIKGEVKIQKLHYRKDYYAAGRP